MRNQLIKMGGELPWETMDTDNMCKEISCDEPARTLSLLESPTEECTYNGCICDQLIECENNDLQMFRISEGEICRPPIWQDDACQIEVDIKRQAVSKPLQKTPPLPDISKGIGKKQENNDLYELEAFAVKGLPIYVVDGDTCIHNGRFWERLEKRKFSMHLREYYHKYKLDVYLTAREYTEIYNMILINQYVQRDKFITPEHSLNLMDGRLDLTNMQVYPHNREDGYFSCLPLYSDDILNPVYGAAFERFMEDNPLIRQQILEMIAIALTGHQAKAFYVLVGPTNTGKSQIIRFLIELLEQENVMSFPAPSELNKQFALADAKHKRIMVCSDIPDAVIPAGAVSKIKQLSSDSDPITVEAKHCNQVTIYQKPLIIMGSNHPIKIANVAKEEAFLKRQITIPFGKSVPLERQIPDLHKLLLEEAGYIIALACEAYRGLMQNGFQLTRAEYVPVEYDTCEGRVSIADVESFVQVCCEVSPEYKVSTDELFQIYGYEAFNEGWENLTKIEFARALAQVLAKYDEIIAVKRIDGKDMRGHKGIRLKAKWRE